MRYGRKICKELFVILYVFIFLVSDPKLVRACSMIILPDTSKETITSDDVTFDFFDTQDPSVHDNLYRKSPVSAETAIAPDLYNRYS